MGPSWGRLGAILGPSWGLLGPSWGLLGGSRGHLGAILGIFRRPNRSSIIIQKPLVFTGFGRPQGVLDALKLGQVGVKLPSRGVLKPSWRQLGEKMAIRCQLGGNLGHLKAVLKPSWSHLGASWGRLGASWAALGALLGLRGRLLGPS